MYYPSSLGFTAKRFLTSLIPAGFALTLLVASSLVAQQNSSTASAPARAGSASGSSVVPHLVSYSSVLTDAVGKPVTVVTGVTFLLYPDQQGGVPVWMETQNVSPDKAGHYTAQLGATRSEGLPTDVFATGEARWLAVQVAGEAEQPRVLLVAVPYAMKAADAETVGGLPASAFVLAAPIAGGVASPANQVAAAEGSSAVPLASSNVTTTGGTVNTLPLWTSATNIQSSAITQTGNGTTAKIGIGTPTPAAALDVKGAEMVRGALTLPATGIATATAGKNSQPQHFIASSFSSTISTTINQNFQWQAEPANNNTANPSGTLNLLYGLGATTPTETGLRIGPKGIIAFAAGQTFPGTGPGTITHVTAGTDLTGGGGSGNVTLNLDTTKVPQLSSANTFTGNQTVNGNLSATGLVTGSGYQIGSGLIAFGSLSSGNAFLGFSGNSTMTGYDNTAIGPGAFTANTTGVEDVAIGLDALASNTTGYFDIAIGVGALNANMTGIDNTAVGLSLIHI